MYISKDLCRICLNNPGAVSIYDKSAQFTIIDAIESITNVHILHNENYPNSICLICLDNINSSLKLCEDVKFAEEHLKQHQTDSEPTIIIDTDEDENSTLKLLENVEVLVGNLSQSCSGEQSIHFYGEQQDPSALLSQDFIHTEQDLTPINNVSEETTIIEIETDDDKEGILNSDEISNYYKDSNLVADEGDKGMLVRSQTVTKSVAGPSANLKSFKRRRKSNRLNFTNKKKSMKESKSNRNGEINLSGSSSAKLHTCDICFEQFLNRTYLLNHKMCHTDDKQCICEVCHKSYSSQSSLKWHMHLTHGPSPRMRCRQCSKVFPNERLLQDHMDYQCVKNHICGTCGKGFYRFDNMKVHISTVHLKLKNFKCNECGKAFGVSSNLRSHIRNVHQKPNACSFD